MNLAFQKIMIQPFIKNTQIKKFPTQILNTMKYIQSKIHQMSCYILTKNTMVKCIIE